MKLNKGSRLLLLWIASLFLAQASVLGQSAQSSKISSPQIEAVRPLSDGNWLLKIDGELLQTISESQKRDILKAQIELESARKELELLRSLKRDYEAMSGLFESMRVAQTNEAAALAAQLAIVNQRQVESDAMIKELVKATKRNRIEAALSNPLLTLAFKLAVPIAGLWR